MFYNMMRVIYNMLSERNLVNINKNPCTWSTRMYRKNNPHQLKFENFYLPFGGHLRSDNRWVILAGQIPWDKIEQSYGELFSDDIMYSREIL